MIKTLCKIALGLALVSNLAITPSFADSAQHRAAVRVCKKRYKAAIAGLKYLKHRARRARLAAARKERDECMALAPK
jgi:hypothetical protein